MLAAVHRDHLPGYGARLDQIADGLRHVLRTRPPSEDRRVLLPLELRFALALVPKRRSRGHAVDADPRRQRLCKRDREPMQAGPAYAVGEELRRGLQQALIEQVDDRALL